MKKRLFTVGSSLMAAIAVLVSLLQGTGALAQTGNPTQAFAHPAFERVWTRTDKLVADGIAGRSWFWGPQPRTATQEQWLEAAGNQRLVQYFDKSRMEINDPNANQNDPFFVTNGLLTVELISGNMQIGQSAYSPRTPACINISGDFDDPTAPTYTSFRTVASVAPGVGRTDPDKRGQPATATLDRAGAVGNDASKATVPGVTYAYYEAATRHNIPQIFWNFLNQQGPVIENGQVVIRQIIVPWFYASGYPVSDAYWARVKIAGIYQDVLIQAYERRVLTYNPNNQPAFQVEMGNIGLHYYDWRYNNSGACTPAPTNTPGTPGTATPTSTPGTPAPTATATVTVTPGASPTVVPLNGKIAFTSKRSGKKDVWTMNADGTTPINVTVGTVGDNYDPAYSPDGSKIVFIAERDGHPEIYVMAANGSSPVRLTNTGPTIKNFDPTWSPDGTKIAFTSDRSTNDDIWVMNADGSNPVNITMQPGSDRNPAWGVNDRIAFVTGRTGNDEIFVMNPNGTALAQLTNSGGNDWLPAWSPTANRILFVSSRDGGNLEVYLMNADGTNPLRLTTLLSDEYDPTWSPDGKYFAYSSNRDGNFELYASYLDGTNLKRLTVDAAEDTQPSWR